MPVYAYQTLDRSGRRTRGRSEAASAGALTRTLQRDGLIILELNAAEQAALGSGRRTGHTCNVLEFSRACAALLGAGMPVARTLATSSLVVPANLAPVIDAVRERVERGASLAEALADYPAVFTPVFTGVVRAGEKSGDLCGAFERLTHRLEREHELRSRLISLSIYPILLALAGGGAVVVLVTFVLPRFTELLTGSGAALPWSTATLLAVSGFTRSHVWLLAIAAALTAALAAAASTTAAGKRSIVRVALALPFVGGLWRERLAGMFASMVGVMTAGGAPLLRALDDTAECMSDPFAREEVRRVRGRVREGASLRQAVAEGASSRRCSSG